MFIVRCETSSEMNRNGAMRPFRVLTGLCVGVGCETLSRDGAELASEDDSSSVMAGHCRAEGDSVDSGPDALLLCPALRVAWRVSTFCSAACNLPWPDVTRRPAAGSLRLSHGYLLHGNSDFIVVPMESPP